MRPIFDLSPFLNQKVSVERYDGKGYVVYACGKDNWEEIYWKHFTAEPRPLFYTTFCSTMLWNEFRYIRRIHQPFLSIEYIMEGELWFRSGKRAFAAEKGDLCLLHRNRNHDFYFQPGKPMGQLAEEANRFQLLPRTEQFAQCVRSDTHLVIAVRRPGIFRRQETYRTRGRTARLWNDGWRALTQIPEQSIDYTSLFRYLRLFPGR